MYVRAMYTVHAGVRLYVIGSPSSAYEPPVPIRSTLVRMVDLPLTCHCIQGYQRVYERVQSVTATPSWTVLVHSGHDAQRERVVYRTPFHARDTLCVYHVTCHI